MSYKALYQLISVSWLSRSKVFGGTSGRKTAASGGKTAASGGKTAASGGKTAASGGKTSVWKLEDGGLLFVKEEGPSVGAGGRCCDSYGEIVVILRG